MQNLSFLTTQIADVTQLKLPVLAMLAPMQEVAATADAAKEVFMNASNVWMMVCAALVFIMNLGFASVEAGFSQTKNTVNILFKNAITPVIGILLYALCGFNLMYPGFGDVPGWFGFAGFGLSLPEGGGTAAYAAGYPYYTDFLFQAMFAATTATIVSGAVAERIKFSAYLIFTIFFVGVVYPICGSWQWGAGMVSSWGFHDFAGSTLVHSVGGWGALAGIILLGPRIGRFAGKGNPFPASNLAFATIGVFILWLGWFGFNGGSVLSSDPALTSLVLTNTTLGACAGAVGAFILATILLKTYDYGMVLNGILAGLVGITAGADVVSPMESIYIGFIAGILVVLAVQFLEKIKLDDVVGAVPVHLVCGVWGTLAVGIWGTDMSFVAQLKGIAVYGAAAFSASFIIFAILKYTMGIRVSAEEETEGLDIHEHGVHAYTTSIVGNKVQIETSRKDSILTENF
jgi:Amt family ammonium transporter